MEASGQNKSIRVAVRVRPLLPSDGTTGSCLLQLDPGRPNEVLLASGSERRTARRYTFDQVFGPDVPQGELYGRAGVSDMVAAVVDGYHATIFAYGQTGSGKTHTMEGYRYVSSGPAAGSPGGRGGAARANGAAAPSADFAATPDDQLGLTPRALRELFALVAGRRDRRFTIRCSFVQIYREQVYDLLNPASLAALPGGGAGRPRRTPGLSGLAVGGPLRLRWSQAEDFYLENLFTPEVDTAEEAISAYQAGVANKVMSSHRLNAASSRSHCLFTLHVASSPAASPLELRTARLSLVDLAGSERAALTGATEGALRDESVAINKSLFTLRQVITALTDASAAAAAAPTSGPQPQQPPAHVHVPYRDSKLTCLLKHSLGGNSLTLMVACLSPADRFMEENASTLDYAARARRITNQVAVNEDPRSRLIRELRAEVAFLRQQLEAAGLAAATAPAPPGVPGTMGAAGLAAGAQPPLTTRNPAAWMLPATTAAAVGGGGGAAGGSIGTGFEGDEAEAAYASRLRAADVEVLVRSVIEASRVAVSTSSALAALRTAYGRTCTSLEALRIEYDSLRSEDARLRDRLAMLEALVGATEGGGEAQRRQNRKPVGQQPWDGAGPLAAADANAGGSAGGEQAGLYTASTAALIELEELRRENTLLHERLQLLAPDLGVYPGGSSGGGGGMAVGKGPSRQGAWGGGHGGGGSRGGGGGGGLPRTGRPGTGSGSCATAQGSTTRAALRGQPRAMSAGALLPSSGGGRVAAAAAAAAAVNPFTPYEVLMAVMPPGSGPCAGGGSGGGGSGSGWSTPAVRPRTGSAAAGGAGGRTLTADQLCNVLQMNGAGAGSSATTGTTEIDGDYASPAAAAAATSRAPAANGYTSRPLTSGAAGAAGGGGGASGRLAELGHAVASRALTSGVRLSTTGKLLPAAPARMAVEAAATGAGVGASGGVGGLGSLGTLRPPTAGAAAVSSGGGAADAGSDGGGDGHVASQRSIPPLPLPPSVPGGGAGSGAALAAEAALAQLLAERNALTRQRLAGGQ